MNDLTLIDERMEVLQAKLQELEAFQAELQELETARRVLLRIRGNVHDPVSPLASIDPASPQAESPKTIAEFSKLILSECNGDGMRYSDVAAEAFKRGYRGKANSDAKAIVQSFWATMHRNSKLFKSLGKGNFRLVNTPTH